ncbi:MAG: peptidylprolyl isomerase [Slackia sp.]|nr:peptidylprolyl isomerase [Slackia sp.]
MKTSGLLRAACVAALTVTCGLGLVACSGGSDADASGADINDVSGGVAATVNGTELGEKAITAYIDKFRSSNGLTEDSDWAQWMVDNGLDATAVREEVIDYYVSQELIRQAAEENGVAVDDAQVDEQISTMRGYYSSDEEWNNALQAVGVTEDQYRDMIKLNLTEAGLKDKVATASEPTEEELLQYAQMYASAYDGAKKSSHILFASDDQATAQEVLDKINAGELDFAEAATQYSTDEGSKADGGNVGWDKLTSFVEEYQTALDGLEKDQVSGLVTTNYGIHIIKCTDVFTAPEEVTSIDQVPTEFADSIRQSVETASKSQAYSDWYKEYKEGAEIVINEMPADATYNVDTTGLTPTSSSDVAVPGVPGSDSSEEASAEGDASAEDEAAGEEGAAEDAAADEASADQGAEDSSQIPETNPDASRQ